MTGKLCHWSTRTINVVVKHDRRTLSTRTINVVVKHDMRSLSLVYQDNQCGGKA